MRQLSRVLSFSVKRSDGDRQHKQLVPFEDRQHGNGILNPTHHTESDSVHGGASPCAGKVMPGKGNTR